MSAKYGVNPDNVATPIAASLGDLRTGELVFLGVCFAFLAVIKMLSSSWFLIVSSMCFLISS